MPCRVGITTDRERRRADWERKVVGLSDWRILDSYRSRERAQEHEDRYALSKGCHASPGGADTGGMWYVYRFDYVRERS